MPSIAQANGAGGERRCGQRRAGGAGHGRGGLQTGTCVGESEGRRPTRNGTVRTLLACVPVVPFTLRTCTCLEVTSTILLSIILSVRRANRPLIYSSSGRCKPYLNAPLGFRSVLTLSHAS